MVDVVAFDLEITESMAIDVDWKEQRPLGISCAATLTSGGIARTWYDDKNGADVAVYGDRMTPEQVRMMTDYLLDFINQGGYVVTWNGLGFDFDVLAEECQHPQYAQQVADMAMSGHIDPGFQMVCQRGFMVGLEKAAKGLHVGGKTEGMHGALAPLLWTGQVKGAPVEHTEDLMAVLHGEIELAGTMMAQKLCLEYVAQDSKATMDVYNALLQQKELWWVTAKGTICQRSWKPVIKNDRLLTVEEAMRLKEVDTSWMTDPRPRSYYFDWVTQTRAKGRRNLSL